MPQFCPKYDVISKKKGFSPKFEGFFGPKTSDLQKKKEGFISPEIFI